MGGWPRALLANSALHPTIAPLARVSARVVGPTEPEVADTPSWVSRSAEQRQEINALLQPPGWRLLPTVDLPSAFPATFREKIDSALVIAEPTSTGGTYLVINARRVELKAQAVDIEPFGVIVNSTGSSTSGAFIHHGAWEGRTELPPTDFWDQVEQSGIGNYYLTNPPAGAQSGTLDQLPVGDRGAFDAVVRELRKAKDG